MRELRRSGRAPGAPGPETHWVFSDRSRGPAVLRRPSVLRRLKAGPNGIHNACAIIRDRFNFRFQWARLLRWPRPFSQHVTGRLDNRRNTKPARCRPYRRATPWCAGWRRTKRATRAWPRRPRSRSSRSREAHLSRSGAELLRGGLRDRVVRIAGAGLPDPQEDAERADASEDRDHRDRCAGARASPRPRAFASSPQRESSQWDAGGKNPTGRPCFAAARTGLLHS